MPSCTPVPFLRSRWESLCSSAVNPTTGLLRRKKDQSPAEYRSQVWLVYAATTLCELGAAIGGTQSPLTRDFIRIGRVSYWGDTRRAREELIPDLEYSTLKAGSRRCDAPRRTGCTVSSNNRRNFVRSAPWWSASADLFPREFATNAAFAT